jgi:hypothetical protein
MEIARDRMNVALVMERLGVQPREKTARLKHDIANCLASIQTADYMLHAPDLPPEERLSLLSLQQQASNELAALIETARISMVV